MLREGRLHLSAIAKLAAHLTDANQEWVLARAAGKSKREIEELVAELEPRPDVPTAIRKVPARAPEPGMAPLGAARAAESGQSDAASPQPDALTCPPAVPCPISHAAVVEPRSPARYKVQFTATEDFRDKLERLQDLMRSSVPDGDLAQILEAAVTEKLARLEANRFGSATSRRGTEGPEANGSSRHVPAAIRRAVYERDKGRCRFVDASGRRCRSRTRLELHHVHPWAMGGNSSVGNLRLMCGAHNAFLAERDYGASHMARCRAGGSSSRPPP
jgi:hypothetical protein